MDALTIVHVIISLIGIGSGLVVMVGLLTGSRLNGLTALFLTTTVATSVTGFFFPFHGFTPGHALGIVSLIVLAVAIVARYPSGLAGAWRWIYVISAMVALYLNVFVLIAQSFQKVSVLKAFAPTETEPPFLITQLCALVLFIVLTIVASIRFRVVGTSA